MTAVAMQNSTQDGDFELPAAIDETNSQDFKKSLILGLKKCQGEKGSILHQFA